MAFKYNPHQHVKIWISKNPSIFMNLENQTRLIKMRNKNPKDKITLAYDSSMLNDQAQKDLMVFCEENSIQAFDIDKIDQSELSEKEQALYKHYKKELCSLDNGGCLALASDILRWISPIYKLGTYMDFEAQIDTSKLPEQVIVKSPLLLNIGSLKLGEEEFIFLNNDTIAVVDPEAAKQGIEKIQDTMLDVLTRYDSDYIDDISKIGQKSCFYKQIAIAFKKRKEIAYIEKSCLLGRNKNLSSLELRSLINTATQDIDAFIEFNKSNPSESREMIIKKLRRKLAKELDMVKWLFYCQEYNEIKAVLAQKDELLIDYLMKKERSIYLKMIVFCTTGPIAVTKSLFGGYLLHTKTFEKDAAPKAFGHYQNLNTAFQSPSSIPLNQYPIDMLKYLNLDDGQNSDSSWLDTGILLQKNREAKLQAQIDNMRTSLPNDLLIIKNQLQQKIMSVEKDQKGFFGFYRKQARAAKIEACNEILKCFSDDTFDIRQLRACLVNIYLKKDKVFASLFASDTQQLIEKLEQMCTKAQVFRIADQGYLLRMGS